MVAQSPNSDKADDGALPYAVSGICGRTRTDSNSCAFESTGATGSRRHAGTLRTRRIYHGKNALVEARVHGR